jgi:ABC-type Fe3+-hydroxamate transport system substrate-binding protein
MSRVSNNETPEERFKRIATVRTNAVLDKIRILGNLSNRQMYSYSEEDINKIFSAINKQIKEVRAKFNSKKEKRFKL